MGSSNAGSVAGLSEELLALEARRERGDLDSDGEQRRQELLRQLFDRLLRPGAGDRERRRFVRIAAPMEVRFRTGEATLTARADEMGLGGLSLRDHLWVIAGQQMRIETIRIHEREYPLPVCCRVVWRVSQRSSTPCVGLQFVDLDDSAQRLIRTIFEALFIAYLRDLPEDGSLPASGQAEPAQRPRPAPGPAPARADPPGSDSGPATAPDSQGGWLDRVRDAGFRDGDKPGGGDDG